MSKYLLFVFLFVLSVPAFAQCTSPSGVESQTRYSGNKLYYCGGGTWHEVPGGSGGGNGAGCVVGSVYAPDGYTHTFFSAETHANCASIGQARTCTNGVLSGGATYQYAFCNPPAPDTTPDTFSFNDVTGAPLNTLTTPSPATITISGINVSTPVSVSGESTARISINGGSWVTSGNITNGQTLAVRMTSANASNTTRTATINVGGVTDSWTVGTITTDTTPNAFSFNDVTGAAFSTLITPSPATVTISGINASTPVSVSGQGSPQISINGGTWATFGNITNGQTLAVRLTSASSGNTTNTATINVGGVTDNWSVTTNTGTASCTLNGVTVLHGNSRLFYSTSSPPYGNRCTSYNLTRTCTNGTLSGNSSYNRANCTDNCAANEGQICGYYCVNACMLWCGGCSGGWANSGTCNPTTGSYGCFSGGSGLIARKYDCAGTCSSTNWP